MNDRPQVDDDSVSVLRSDLADWARRVDAAANLLGEMAGGTARDAMHELAGVIALRVVERPRFTCPRCKRTSYHPHDVREGYCGACHAWTGLAPGDPVLSQERP
ncbi:MAG: hypothetical protein ACRDQU_12445 [Pseudonocardiaceae bacterium]